MKEENYFYQTVTLILADGRRVTYTGRAQIEVDKPIAVTNVEVSIPQRLPIGMSWDSMPQQNAVSDPVDASGSLQEG